MHLSATRSSQHSLIYFHCHNTEVSKLLSWQVITLLELGRFLEEQQGELRTQEELRALLHRHEPDPFLR